MAKQPKKEKDERKPWVDLPSTAYQACLAGVGHLFSKPVNTNARQVCIRLNTPGNRLPYISVSTLGSLTVPLDFSGLTGNLKAAGQLLSTLEGTQDMLYAGVTPESHEVAESFRESCEAFSSNGAEVVDARLRQVLLPSQGDYVAITPLHSAGLSMLINAAVKREKEKGLEAKQQYGYRKPALFPVGGSKPQNVGLRTRELGRPLVFRAPVQHQATRLAYAYHFKGISLVPPRPLIAAYRIWLHTQRQASRGPDGEVKFGITGTHATRGEESDFITKMVEAVLARAKNASELLAHSKFTPLVDKQVDAPVAALLDSGAQYPGWEIEVANRILRGIANAELAKRDTGGAHATKPDDFALLPYHDLVSLLVRRASL